MEETPALHTVDTMDASSLPSLEPYRARCPMPVLEKHVAPEEKQWKQHGST